MEPNKTKTMQVYPSIEDEPIEDGTCPDCGGEIVYSKIDKVYVCKGCDAQQLGYSSARLLTPTDKADLEIVERMLDEDIRGNL